MKLVCSTEEIQQFIRWMKSQNLLYNYGWFVIVLLNGLLDFLLIFLHIDDSMNIWLISHICIDCSWFVKSTENGMMNKRKMYAIHAKEKNRRTSNHAVLIILIQINCMSLFLSTILDHFRIYFCFWIVVLCSCLLLLLLLLLLNDIVFHCLCFPMCQLINVKLNLAFNLAFICVSFHCLD